MIRRRKLWTPEDDELLRKLKAGRLHSSEIASHLKCTIAALDSRWQIIRNRDDPDEKPRGYNRKTSRREKTPRATGRR